MPPFWRNDVFVRVVEVDLVGLLRFLVEVLVEEGAILVVNGEMRAGN